MINTYQAILVVEDHTEYSEEEFEEAWQHLIDTGVAWSLQGWYGQTAEALIETGNIKPPLREEVK